MVTPVTSPALPSWKRQSTMWRWPGRVKITTVQHRFLLKKRRKRSGSLLQTWAGASLCVALKELPWERALWSGEGRGRGCPAAGSQKDPAR